ncbi:hypothetical protein K9L97_04680 [Candidatus Woesearchaeota archaeon]|nr:hypothetical protein [Candidatus Woesearchaeota archaeon]
MNISLEQFKNPLYDAMKVVQRQIHRESSSGQVSTSIETGIEGITLTENYREIGFTYLPKDGTLYLNFLDKNLNRNVRIYNGKIKTIEEFEKRLKNVDRKIKEYRSKN